MVVFLTGMGGVELSQLTEYGTPSNCLIGYTTSKGILAYQVLISSSVYSTLGMGLPLYMQDIHVTDMPSVLRQ